MDLPSEDPKAPAGDHLDATALPAAFPEDDHLDTLIAGQLGDDFGALADIDVAGLFDGDDDGNDNDDSEEEQRKGTGGPSVERDHHQKQEKEEEDRATDDDTAAGNNFEYLTASQLNGHDVLCARGFHSAHFRTVLDGRRREYADSATRREKSRIAREVVQHVRSGLDPPGRFLRPATADEAEAWELSSRDRRAGVWVLAEEGVALERAKMGLRRGGGGQGIADRDGDGHDDDGKEEQRSNVPAVKPDDHHRQQHEEEVEAAAVAADNFEYLTASQLNGHDVLCARGFHSAHFRTVLDRWRREYADSATRREKSRIAQEVVHHVRSGLHPPGRFLRPATADEAEAWELSSEDQQAGVWVIAEEGAALERAKMGLRRGGGKKKQQQGQSVSQAAGRSGGRKPSASKANSAKKSGTQLSPDAGNKSKISSGGGAKHDETGSASHSAPQLTACTETDRKDGTAIHELLYAPTVSEGSLGDGSSGWDSAPSEGTRDSSQDDDLWEPIALPEVRIGDSSLAGAAGSVVQNSATDLSTEAPPPPLLPLRVWIALSSQTRGAEEISRSSIELTLRLSCDIIAKVMEHHTEQRAFGDNAINTDSFLVSGNVHDTKSKFAVELVGVEPSVGPASMRSDFDSAAKHDLANLGAVLYELFSGLPPYPDSDGVNVAANRDHCAAGDREDGQATKKRGDNPSSRRGGLPVPLREVAGLPSSLDFLVDGLLQSGRDDVLHRFKSTREVVDAICIMLRDSDGLLFNSDASSLGGQGQETAHKLVLRQDKMYGRDDELASMVAAYNRVTGPPGAPAEVILVSGTSGSGKTHLALQVLQKHIERGGYLFAGKFDGATSRANPLFTIVNALGAFCDELLARGGDNLVALETTIRDAVGDSGDSLLDLIPNLSRILGKEGTRRALNPSEGSKEGLNRMMFFFHRFFCAISSSSHPLIIFLDDLQWADPASLELMRFVVTSGISSFLFIGCYRSNEIDGNVPWTEFVGGVILAGVPLHNISLDGIDKSSVNCMVSDALRFHSWLTQSLSALVFQKTGGNPLFVIQLLFSLCDEGLLQYSASSRRWVWDEEAITSLNIADSVADLMNKKLLRLGPREQWGLKVAACLGAQSKETTLALLGMGLGTTLGRDLVKLLDQAVAEGYLSKVGDVYKWSHDKFQEASYALVDVQDRPALHFQIGTSLFETASTLQREEILFAAVDQLNRGSSIIQDNDEKLKLAQLNHRAGKKCLAASNFLAASIYLKLAIGLLREEDWQNSYQFTLELYTSCAETDYVIGSHETMQVFLNEVLKRARTFMPDKLRAYYTLTCGFWAQFDVKNALGTGVVVLGLLGESFDQDNDEEAVMSAVGFTKNMIADNCKGDFFSDIPLMSDEKKLFTMKFLNLLSVYAFFANSMMMPLLVCKMVELTITHGACRESASGFGIFGQILCGFMGDLQGGYRSGNIARQLLEKADARSTISRVYLVLYGAVNVWVEPVQSCLPQLMVGHDTGLASGDPECAVMCASICVDLALQCGQPLGPLISDIRALVKETSRSKIKFDHWAQESVFLQFALSFAGSSEGPEAFNGNAFGDESSLLEFEGNPLARCVFYLKRLVHAYTFGLLSIASETAKKCREANMETTVAGKFESCTFVFFDGLTALAVSRGSAGGQCYNDVIEKAVDKMSVWAASSSWNCQHRLELLRAERFALAGVFAEAGSSYRKAIDLAREHKFLNEEALALERYGTFLEMMGDKLSSQHQFDRAYETYMKWGATAKADDVKSSRSYSIRCDD